MTSNTETPDLWQFPCDFPIKIMGERHDDFAQTIASLVQQYAADFNPAQIEMRPSSSGKYLSLTCTVRATSKDQLDALYQALSAHPMVKAAL